VAADSLRRRRRRPLLLGQEAAEALAGAVAEVADAERDRLSHLSRCIQELDGRAREICELRYRQDLAPSAIASMLGIQPNTAAKALQRVREQLRQCIERRVRAEAGL
jgi:RNA polymerase sigma-70 factor (ECF subfamily)